MAIPAAGQPSNAGQSSLEINNDNFPSLPSSKNTELTTLPIFSPTTNASKSTQEQYEDLLKPIKINSPKSLTSQVVDPLPIKKLLYVDGIPKVMWMEEEVGHMNKIENLQYAVIGKFSYGWPELEELRTLIPIMIDVKGDCKIGFLRNRHILVRFNL
ncbi:hypothetical protein FXO37_36732 [Capsicum annuum]|nr:hypothetical protein FXO37_36732 [Capsicum annuum]